MNVKEFIEQHEHVNYCEAVVYPNGDIEYAERGHVNKLIEITNESRDKINSIMPNNANPLHWMVCYTKCISLWYDFLFYNEITKEQYNTIQELVNNDILRNGITCYYTDELERCDILNRGDIDEVYKLTRHSEMIINKQK